MPAARVQTLPVDAPESSTSPSGSRISATRDLHGHRSPGFRGVTNHRSPGAARRDLPEVTRAQMKDSSRRGSAASSLTAPCPDRSGCKDSRSQESSSPRHRLGTLLLHPRIPVGRGGGHKIPGTLPGAPSQGFRPRTGAGSYRHLGAAMMDGAHAGGRGDHKSPVRPL